MSVIDSFDTHYSEICRKLHQRYIFQLVCCAGCMSIDVVRKAGKRREIFKSISRNISGQKNFV